MEGSDVSSFSSPRDSCREGLGISGPSCCRYSRATWRLRNAFSLKLKALDLDFRSLITPMLNTGEDHETSTQTPWFHDPWQSSQRTSVTQCWFWPPSKMSQEERETPSYGSFSTPGQILGVGVPSNSQVSTSWCSCHWDIGNKSWMENIPKNLQSTDWTHLCRLKIEVFQPNSGDTSWKYPNISQT